MIIFQRMQIWGAALLLTVGILFTSCGDAVQNTKADENIVVVYNCNAEDWAASIAKEFQEETGIQVRLISGSSDELMTRVRTAMLSGAELRLRTSHSNPIWSLMCLLRKLQFYLISYARTIRSII